MSNPLAEIPVNVCAVDRLEKDVASSSDPSLRALLVETLADRYRWVGIEGDRDRLRLHLKQLPPDAQHFGSAFLASHDDDFARASKHFLSYTEALLSTQTAAPDANFAWWLYLRYLIVTEFFPGDDAIDLQSAIGHIFAKKWPGAPISLYENSQVSLMRGAIPRSRNELSTVLRKDPGFWIASYDLAMILAVQEDWNNAANCLANLLERKIVRRDPMLCYQAACLFIRADRKAEAREATACYVECLQRASETNCAPSSDAIVLINAHLSLTIGIDESVQKAFAELLLNEGKNRWKESTFLLYLLGQAAWASEDKKGALSYFADANRRDNTFWLAAVGAAQVYAGENNWDLAADWYRRALRVESAEIYHWIWFEAAWCFGKTKSNDEEIEAYRRCLKCYPRCVYGKNNLGWALLKAGKLEESEKLLREAVTLEEERPYAAWNLARVLKKLKRLQEAIDALKQDKTAKGTVRKSAANEIAKLEELLKSNAKNADDPILLASERPTEEPNGLAPRMNPAEDLVGAGRERDRDKKSERFPPDSSNVRKLGPLEGMFNKGS